MVSRAPIVPDRVRRIGGCSFAFILHRFLRDGFLASLSSDERSLYFFLVLAADRNGISCRCRTLTAARRPKTADSGSRGRPTW